MRASSNRSAESQKEIEQQEVKPEEPEQVVKKEEEVEITKPLRVKAKTDTKTSEKPASKKGS